MQLRNAPPEMLGRPLGNAAADLNPCSSLLPKRSLWLRRGEPSAVIHQTGSVVTAWLRFVHAANGRALGGAERFVQELPARWACALAAASNAATKATACDRLPSRCGQGARLDIGSEDLGANRRLMPHDKPNSSTRRSRHPRRRIGSGLIHKTPPRFTGFCIGK